MIGIRKKNKYNVDIKTADQMLQSVFAACDTAPNRVPFDKMVLRSRQNLFTDNLFIVIACVLFALTLVVPVFLPHSPIFVSVDAKSSRPLLVKEHAMTESTFTISFEGHPLDLSATCMVSENNEYIYPESYDRDTNTVAFPYTKGEYNIYIYDIEGKCLHLLLSPHDK